MIFLSSLWINITKSLIECSTLLNYLPAVVPSYGQGIYVTDLLKQLGPGIWWEMVNMALCT